VPGEYARPAMLRCAVQIARSSSCRLRAVVNRWLAREAGRYGGPGDFSRLFPLPAC
jgi:hypothetical protein